MVLAMLFYVPIHCWPLFWNRRWTLHQISFPSSSFVCPVSVCNWIFFIYVLVPCSLFPCIRRIHSTYPFEAICTHLYSLEEGALKLRWVCIIVPWLSHRIFFIISFWKPNQTKRREKREWENAWIVESHKRKLSCKDQLYWKLWIGPMLLLLLNLSHTPFSIVRLSAFML